ncbi:putative serine incorporator [Sesbania bispinosa]|nr:putative serine incorporator [Sesbania bispinosa]
MVACHNAAAAISFPVDNHVDHSSRWKTLCRCCSYCDTFIASSASIGSAIPCSGTILTKFQDAYALIFLVVDLLAWVAHDYGRGALTEMTCFHNFIRVANGDTVRDIDLSSRAVADIPTGARFRHLHQTSFCHRFRGLGQD